MLRGARGGAVVRESLCPLAPCCCLCLALTLNSSARRAPGMRQVNVSMRRANVCACMRQANVCQCCWLVPALPGVVFTSGWPHQN